MANHQYQAADPSWEHVTPSRTAPAAIGPVDAPFVAVAAAPPGLPTSPRTRAPPPLGLGLFASTADRAAVHHLTASALAGLRGSLRAVTSTNKVATARAVVVSPALSLASVSTDESMDGSLHVENLPAPVVSTNNAEIGTDAAAARGPSTRNSWDPTVFVRTALKWVQPIASGSSDTAHLDDASSSPPRNASDWAVDVDWVSETVRQGPAAPDFWTLVDSLTQHMAASADVASKTHPGAESIRAGASVVADGSVLGPNENNEDDEDETSSLIDATMADVDEDSDSDHSMDDDNDGDVTPAAHDETPPSTEHTPSASTPFSILHAPSPAPAPAPVPASCTDLASSFDRDVSASDSTADLPPPPPPLAHQSATPRASDAHLLHASDRTPSTRPSTATSSWLSDADRRTTTTTSTLSASHATTTTVTSDIDGSETVATHALRDRIQELEGFVARLMAESAAAHAAQVALRDHAARLAATVKAQQVELDKFHVKWAKIREAVKRKRAARAAVGAGAAAVADQRDEDDDEDGSE
ncbi:hypothetical protein GGF31_005071 [Allomyces arbusculus]|nr:hypothetical protein GGF31_005071 [Allomyces arbusculus]